MADDRLTKVKTFWRLADSEWRDWADRAQKARDFYIGKQWDNETLEQLKLEKRPALTFNKVKPIIRNLSGWQRQNRQDLKVLARRGGYSQLADIYSELIKYFYDISYADWKQSEQFVNGLITGKGWIFADIDYIKDPLNGDLVLRVPDTLLVWEDPHAMEYDLSDARFLIRGTWMDKEQVEESWPKAKKDMALLDSIPTEERQAASLDTSDYNRTGANQEMFELAKTRYLVKECQWREYKNKKFLINLDTLEVEDVSVKSIDNLLRIVQNFPRLRLVKRVTPVMNITTFIGDIELDHQTDPWNGITYFTGVRFTPDITNIGEIYVKGEVDDLIDPQKEINKRRSQALHHLNSSANSGWVVEEDGMDKDEREKLEKMGSMPGVVVVYKRGKNKPERITPGQLSDGHIVLSQQSENDLKSISGVNSDLLGVAPEKQESGIAMQLRRQHGLVTTESIFDNYEYSQRQLGDLILEFIRKSDVLSDEEIQAIALEKGKKVDMSLLRSRKVGKYSVVMSEHASSPTLRLANFMTMLDAVKNGLQIPKEMIVEASDWPFKDQLLDAWKQQEAAQQPSMQTKIPPQGGVPLPPMQGVPGPVAGQ